MTQTQQMPERIWAWRGPMGEDNGWSVYRPFPSLNESEYTRLSPGMVAVPEAEAKVIERLLADLLTKRDLDTIETAYRITEVLASIRRHLTGPDRRLTQTKSGAEPGEVR